MSRRMTDLMIAIICATVLVGLSAQARSGPTSEPARAPNAANESSGASSDDLLRTVQQTRVDVRKLRDDIEVLRKRLESKPQSNPGKPVSNPSQIYRVTTTNFDDGDGKVRMLYVMPVATDDHRPVADSPPTADEILRTLPDWPKSLLAGVCQTEVVRKNVRIVVDKIVDKVGECRFYPLVGNARLKKCHYKCTVYFDKTTRSDWPIPFLNVHPTQAVVYIDRDHLIRCADSDAPAKLDSH